MNGCGCAPICLFTKAGDWLTAGVRQAHAELLSCRVIAVVMNGCESWTVNKAECQRIDAFELWCWRRLLRVPWTGRKSTLTLHWKD